MRHSDNPFAATTTGSYEPPSWLSSEAPGANSNGYSQVQRDDASNGPSQQQSVTIPRMILVTRMLNLGLSICMLLASLLSLLTTNSATTGVLACYVVVFSCLLCCFETHLKQISKVIANNFGFLYSAKSRSAFMIFIGTIMFSFSLFGKIIGIMMLANAGFNIYILFTFPEFEDAQRRDAQSEIADYLSANPAFAKSVASLGMSAATGYLANNPDAARQGANAYLNSVQSSPTQSTVSV